MVIVDHARLLFVMGCLVFLSTCSGVPKTARGPAGEAERLPDQVWLRELTNTFTMRWDYALFEGKIYTRPRGQTDFSAWALLDGTGIPDYPSFKDKHFVEVTADADELLAVDNEGLIHHYGPLDQKIHWHKEGFGSPLAEFFPMLAEKKTWNIGRKSADVMYYEDALGQQFHWGIMGTTTVYILSKNGQEINLGDTGLAPDFSRQLCGPERGRFVAESLSAAGATMFVISKSGEMFTRLDDYDADGGTPFYRYSYDKITPHGVPGTSLKSEYRVRYLPLPPWRSQPRINTGEHGRLSRKITILITGHGDASRELRVAGIGPGGHESGFYYKPIFGLEWKFQPAPILLNDSDLIENDPTQMIRAPNNDRIYKGWLKLGKEQEQIPVTFSDFNLHCSPVNLEVEIEHSHVPLVLHTVDAWHLFKQTDAEHDSRGIKLLKATLEVPDAARNHPDPAVRAFVAKYFMPAHHQTFAISVVATRGFVNLEVKHPSVKPTFSLFATSEENNRPTPVSYYLERAADPALEIPPDADRATLEQVLSKNRLALEEIEKTRSRLHKERTMYSVFEVALTLPRGLQRVFGNKMYGSGRPSALANAVDQSYALLDASRKAYKSSDVLFGNSRENYENARNTVRERIKRCQVLLGL